jgi:hypothetical protein
MGLLKKLRSRPQHERAIAAGEWITASGEWVPSAVDHIVQRGACHLVPRMYQLNLPF